MNAKFKTAPGPPPAPLWTPSELKAMQAGEKAVDALPYGNQNPKADKVRAEAEAAASK